MVSSVGDGSEGDPKLLEKDSDKVSSRRPSRESAARSHLAVRMWTKAIGWKRQLNRMDDVVLVRVSLNRCNSALRRALPAGFSNSLRPGGSVFGERYSPDPLSVYTYDYDAAHHRAY